MNATDKGLTLWFTGLSGSGKSTLATYLAPKLKELGKRVEIPKEGKLLGEVVRVVDAQQVSL